MKGLWGNVIVLKRKLLLVKIGYFLQIFPIYCVHNLCRKEYETEAIVWRGEREEEDDKEKESDHENNPVVHVSQHFRIVTPFCGEFFFFLFYFLHTTCQTVQPE